MPTAAFLSTDSEGSTRRWATAAVAMRSAVARHDEPIVDAVGAVGGTVFKHSGDGMLARFPTASSALLGAAGRFGPLR